MFDHFCAVRTHKASRLQSGVEWCAQTERLKWGAELRWCSWYSATPLSSASESAWTSPASGSRTSSPGPLRRSQRTSSGPPSPAPSPTSSPSWWSERERDKRMQPNEEICKGRGIINHWIPLGMQRTTLFTHSRTRSNMQLLPSQSVKVLVMKYETWVSTRPPSHWNRWFIEWIRWIFKSKVSLPILERRHIVWHCNSTTH